VSRDAIAAVGIIVDGKADEDDDDIIIKKSSAAVDTRMSSVADNEEQGTFCVVLA
jgi:hypothetical protein